MAPKWILGKLSAAGIRLALLVSLVLVETAAEPLTSTVFSTVDIFVKDGSSNAPIAFARVMITGCDFRVGYSDEKGEVLFQDVRTGICNVTAEDGRHKQTAAYSFTARDGDIETLAISLSSAGPKVIASVRSRAPILSGDRIGTASPLRALDDSLSVALGMQSDVLASPGGNSIDGKDYSQTGYTIDGAPMIAPWGQRGPGVDADLFAGSATNTSPSAGSLAGTIGYETALPTVAWITSGASSFGAFDSNAIRLQTTGSIGDVGIVAGYANRNTFDFTNDKMYLDTSGLTYLHQGLKATSGFIAKLRIPTGELGSVTLTGIFSRARSDLTCPYFVASVPCGYGPGLADSQSDRQLIASYQGITGRTNVNLTYVDERSLYSESLGARVIGLLPDPLASDTMSRTSGVSASATGSIGVKHVATGSIIAFVFSNAFDQHLPIDFRWNASSSYLEANVTDSYAWSSKTSLQTTVGISRAGVATAGLKASIGLAYQAGANDTFQGQVRIGDQQLTVDSPLVLPDPESLLYSCANHFILGDIQGGDKASAQHSEGASLGWQHRAPASRLFGIATFDKQSGVPAQIIVNASTLVGSVLPSTYVDQVASFASTSSACPVGTFSVPSDIFFNMPVQDVRRNYATLRLGYAGQIAKDLQFGAFASLVRARASSESPLLNNPYSVYIPGQQIPNVPFAKGLLLLDYRHANTPVEGIIGLQYLSANNPFNLPASLQASAGIAWNAPVGKFVISGRNLTNAFAGDFYSSRFAEPLETLQRGPLGTIAQPFHQRSFSIQFLPRIGRAPSEHAPTAQIDADAMAESGFVQTEVDPLPDVAPVDPIHLRDDSGTCEAQTYRKLEPDVSALKAFIKGLKPQLAPFTRTFGSLSATYEPWRDSYVLTIKPDGFNTSVALLNCVTFHQGTNDEYKRRGLFVPPNVSVGEEIFLFSPSVGIYLYDQTPNIPAPIKYATLPSSRPQRPFEIQKSCASTDRPVVEHLLAALKPVLTIQVVGTQTFGWGSVTTKALPIGGYWSDIKISDVFSVAALQGCLNVAATEQAALEKAGLEGAPLPDINFSQNFGFYVVAR